MVRKRRRTRRSGDDVPVVVIRNRPPLLETPKSEKRGGAGSILQMRQRMRTQAVITKAVLEAWLDGRSLNEIFRSARAAGFRGNLDALWYVLQRGTGWPDVLWGKPAARRPRCSRKRLRLPGKLF